MRLGNLIELVGVLTFFGGLIGHSRGVWVAGAICLIIHVGLDLLSGALNPMFTILLVVVLAVFVHPLLRAIGWSLAPFAVLNIPIAMQMILKPE